jgi:hypothetical protein
VSCTRGQYLHRSQRHKLNSCNEASFNIDPIYSVYHRHQFTVNVRRFGDRLRFHHAYIPSQCGQRCCRNFCRLLRIDTADRPRILDHDSQNILRLPWLTSELIYLSFADSSWYFLILFVFIKCTKECTSICSHPSKAICSRICSSPFISCGFQHT